MLILLVLCILSTLASETFTVLVSFLEMRTQLFKKILLKPFYLAYSFKNFREITPIDFQNALIPPAKAHICLLERVILCVSF